MDRYKLHQDIQALALALTLLTFPFHPFILNNICVILLGINWLAQGNFKLKFNTLRQRKIALLYVGLYMIFIISYFFSEDKNQAARILERNLFIFCVPIILATSRITKRQRNKALYALIVGCLLAITLCLSYAVYRYSIDQKIHYFFYHDLTRPVLGLHAVYFSLYLGAGILFLILRLEEKWRDQTWNYRTLRMSLILILYGFVILLSSKTIIITLTLLINLIFILWIIKKNKKLAGILAIAIINLSVLIGVFNTDYVKERFLNSLNYNIEFIKKDSYSELTVFTGVTVRLTFWKFIIEILNENDSWWTGMTIGDGDNALHDKAVEKNLYGGNEEMGWTNYTSYNAHNQYFQYLLLIGVLGLAYFLFMLIAILRYSLKHKNLLLLLITLLFMSFCFTESVLAVHKGIIFFSIIPTLLIYSRGCQNHKQLTKGIADGEIG